MPSAPAYDPTNIFARILAGEVPCHAVWEDADTLAFMDIMPRCQGHTLVIPKRRSRGLLDAAPEDLAVCLRTVKRVARAQRQAFGAHGTTVQQFNEPAGGQVVFHLHFHVLPRWEGVRLAPHTGTLEKPEVLATNALQLRKALGE